MATFPCEIWAGTGSVKSSSLYKYLLFFLILSTKNLDNDFENFGINSMLCTIIK